MGTTQHGPARDIRKAADTLPEHPPLDAAIAALDLAPPPELTLSQAASHARAPVSSGIDLVPVPSAAPIVPVVGSSASPVPTSLGPSSLGRDIAREERRARRNTMIVVASIWTFAIALVGVLLFMIRQ